MTSESPGLARAYLRLLSREPVYFGVAFLCTVVLSALQLPGPWLSMRAIDAANIGIATSFDLVLICALLLLTVGTSLTLRTVQAVTIESLKNRMLIAMQTNAVEHALWLPVSAHRRWPHTYLLSRVEQDPVEVQSILAGSVLRVISDIATLSMTVIFLANMHWRLALLAATGMPAIALVFVRGRAALKNHHVRLREQSARLHGFLGEQLSAVFTIKCFVLERHVLNGFRARADRLARAKTKLARVKSTYDGLFSLITSGVPVLILGYSIHEIAAGRLTMGQYVAFNALLLSMYRPTEDMIIALLSSQGSAAALARVREIEALPRERWDPQSVFDDEISEGPTASERNVPAVECRNLSIRYELNSPWIVENVSFSCGRGELVGLCGPSGAGKTTLVMAIPGLTTTTTGHIFVLGTNQREVPLGRLRWQVALVASDSRVFSGSVLDNIWCGDRRRPLCDVRRAAEECLVDQFVGGLPDGYDTEVGEGGTRLSAGQRQRVLLARAILRRPGVLILDEATASLDVESERIVLANIHRLLPDTGILIVSHRPDTWSITDRVLVVKDRCVRDWWAVDPNGVNGKCFEPLLGVRTM